VKELIRPYLPRLAGAGLLAAGTELAGVALLATATFLLVRAAQQPPLSALTVAIVAVRALAIGRGTLRYTERLAGHDAALRVLTEVRARVYARLAARPDTAPPYRSGDLLSRLVSDVDAVQDLLLRCAVPAGAAALAAIAAVSVAVLVAPAGGLALAAGLVAAGVVLPALAFALARRTADRVAPLRAAFAVDAVDLTYGVADLAAYGATGAALAAAAGRAAELSTVERRLAAAAQAVDAAGVLVSGVTAAAVAVFALRGHASGVATAVLTVGALAAVEACLGLVGSARRWVEIRASLRRVSELLRAPEEPERTGDLPLAGPVTLALERVSVRYAAGHPAALSTVDLLVQPGHRVAVVGPSGAGKSTLLRVLAGLLDPDGGRVTANGRDLAAYRRADLPAAVTGLLADAHVFHASVRENLALGRPGATDAQLRAALAAAGLLDWLDAQPAGLDTIAGEDGGLLSGGQRQRLALARAVLADPAVLLLDEPTEGLDPHAADRVLADVLVAAGTAGVVLVTHRLVGLESLDDIVVLDCGAIVQRGTHAQLLAEPGWYRDTVGPRVRRAGVRAPADAPAD
jgi:ATP-binding cassette subfamily C protein CydC